MFTGIIESTGKVVSITQNGTNLSFRIESPVSRELKVDQSISHNGVCLTVESLAENTHVVTAIEETLRKTDLINWKEGMEVNLERCMLMNGRLDGHIVQGHVDTTATCTERKELRRLMGIYFPFPPGIRAACD
jgi:riboflavin synthase